MSTPYRASVPTPGASPQWRSLDDLARLEGGGDEFPADASEWPDALSRRRFLQLMAGSLALAGTGACTRQPREEIVPYVRQPEALQPGQPLYFATAMELGGEAFGLLVRSDSGRPTKIEGNPAHPATLGRSSVHMQAALLTLYDPGRSQGLMKSGSPATWEDLLGTLTEQRARWQERAGAGLRLLTRRIASPTLREQIARLLTKYPQAQWHEHDAAFPAPPLPAGLRLERAEVIVSLDADFFGSGALHPRAAFDFAKRRRADHGRLYVVESTPSLTGAMADHRRALRPGELADFARGLARAVREPGAEADPWIPAIARDLTEHRGRSLVVAGEFQSPEVQASARELNEALGNVGQTIDNLPPAPGPRAAALPELARAMHSGEVEALLIFGANPAYDSPADLDFNAALEKVPFTLHHGIYFDETAGRCAWHVPESHFLESWSDARALDGTVSIVQPLIEPLYPSKSAHELFAALLGELPADGYEIVRSAWQQRPGGGGFESAWRKTLHDGIAPQTGTVSAPPAQGATTQIPPTEPAAFQASLELIIRPDPHLLDGRLAENAWLQELPKPFTKLTWGNAAHLSPRTAERLGLAHGDVAELRYRGRTVRAPLWILPGHADECVTIHLGHGRNCAGSVGSGCGFNAFALQTSEAPWGGRGLEIHKTRERHVFATTQEHQRMEGREPVRVETLGKPTTPPAEAAPAREETLYPNIDYGRPSWGMVIDLNTCIGCSACTIACQAENNIPVVGREQVLRGREMHWIRVDAYFAGSVEAPQLLHQPVPCMHCENAPCEAVCPVAATVHDHEGLNVMVYNRCIGTRYCSNNCPYKVRRFNFLSYNDTHAPQLALMRNPEVSVRMRGVMEKCTYCIQRISAARIEAEKEARPIRDGEVVPACAQACPAEAITFGDIHDPESRVAALRQSPRHYALLAELNTRPHTTYLARVRNPNPEIA
ncbi:MAG: hypothetical protein QOE70_5628 [Chthoniobacter sp.]|jgi:molybdopterin-containing oxidoreductase family iron-sulfur binding subunit|nr:hypothetical protein [Chthoniobacter sp.]